MDRRPEIGIHEVPLETARFTSVRELKGAVLAGEMSIKKFSPQKRSMHNHHRAMRTLQNALRIRSQHPAVEDGVAALAQDNEAGLDGVRAMKNLFRRMAEDDIGFQFNLRSEFDPSIQRWRMVWLRLPRTMRLAWMVSAR